MSWLGIGPESALERPGQDIRGNPDFTLLFEDPKAEAVRYFRKTGILPAPAHHCYPREHPRRASLGRHERDECLRRIQAVAMSRMRNQSLFVFTSRYMDEVAQILGPDPFAYGVKTNAAAIDFVQQMSVEQSLTAAQAAPQRNLPRRNPDRRRAALRLTRAADTAVTLQTAGLTLVFLSPPGGIGCGDRAPATRDAKVSGGPGAAHPEVGQPSRCWWARRTRGASPCARRGSSVPIGSTRRCSYHQRRQT